MPYIRNTGMNSLSELFAMKKNMASQVRFDNQMASMTRDYYHRKYNMNMDIKKIFDDMIGIQSSTGYTLGQATQLRSDGKPDRLPNAPKVYLPPIGVRLVEKYVGFDVKRRKSLFDGKNPSAESGDQVKEPHRNSLPQVRKNFRNLLLKKPVKMHNPTDDAPDVNIEINAPDEDVKPRIERRYNVRKEKIKREVTEHSIASVVRKEIDSSEHADQPIPNDRVKTFLTETEENDSSPEGVKHEASELSGQLVFYTSERRSSRSTYRKRASAILLPRTDSLRAHNWQVISDQGYVKSSSHALPSSELGKKFFLDYGDGKLHTTMTIPKMKDCARSWCNATCKTCQGRAASKPCFMLIPSGTQDRQNMLFLQKRRESLFPGNKDEKTDDEDGVNVRMESKGKVDVDINEGDVAEAYTNAENKDTENADDVKDGQSDDDDDEPINEDDNDEFIPEIEKLLLINRKRTQKGYDKDRISDLAQPRFGHPAEVRFSKWSLRKKRDQLKEEARTKQLSYIERDNLAMIQGKISLFLAVLNECEDTSVPRMTHLPIREHVQAPRRRRRLKTKAAKNVGFKTRTRIRLLA